MMSDASHSDRPASHRLAERARRLMPGGVSSPVRAFGAVGGSPVFIRSARGAMLTGEDGESYIDLVGGWGSAILGHAHPAVTEAIHRAAAAGSGFGLCSAWESELATRIVERVPSVEKIRFVNSGTEAVMSAIRLARAATGRDLIVKFDGNYHGHADGLLVQAGSGAQTFGVPDSPGVPARATALTLTAPYNDATAVEQLFAAHGSDIAAVIVEPIAGNMGLVLPSPGFLERIASAARSAGALLICDEVMTGFRVHSGGAQALLGVAPDLTTFGKIIGGGTPIGAYGGSAALMDHIAPAGPVYQAGTMSGNPMAMAAGVAVLDRLDAAAYERLAALTWRLATKLSGAFGVQPPASMTASAGFSSTMSRGSDAAFAARADSQRIEASPVVANSVSATNRHDPRDDGPRSPHAGDESHATGSSPKHNDDRGHRGELHTGEAERQRRDRLERSLRERGGEALDRRDLDYRPARTSDPTRSTADDFLAHESQRTTRGDTLREVHPQTPETAILGEDDARRDHDPVQIAAVPGMLGIFFGASSPITDRAAAAASDHDGYAAFFRGMLDRGVHLPPSGYEACFISLAHTEEHIDRIAAATSAAWAAIQSGT